MFFTEDKDASEPSFGNYDLGGALTVNFNRFVGIEGEVAGGLGISQGLQSGGFSSDVKTPNLLNYSGNIVVVGGESHLRRAVRDGRRRRAQPARDAEPRRSMQTETFLTGNVGGGIKWYAGRWGLRADYRFIGVQSKDDAPAFFGQETRYGHRVYGSE